MSSHTHVEIDFVTKFSIELPPGIHRGGVSMAARANHVIMQALRADGFILLANPGGAVDPLCSTDINRMEFVESDDGK